MEQVRLARSGVDHPTLPQTGPGQPLSVGARAARRFGKTVILSAVALCPRTIRSRAAAKMGAAASAINFFHERGPCVAGSYWHSGDDTRDPKQSAEAFRCQGTV